MIKLNSGVARLSALGMLVVAGIAGLVAANPSNAKAYVQINRGPYEQCLYDNIKNCRAAYPVGPQREQCMIEGKEVCDYAHGMQ